MKKIVTALLVIAALSVASAAMALDLARHTPSFAPNRHPFDTQSVQALIGCDDNVEGNAYFQATDDRLGNVFSFGTGKLLSRVQFVHYGFGFAGPYNYDIELWDPISCTFIAAKNGLVAADASGANTVTENVNLCPANLFATGDVLIAIDPNSCFNPGDCYPDLLFDDQINVLCPWIIQTASTTPGCIEASAFNGPFLLRAEFDNCPTPTNKGTWGSVKAFYR